MPRTPIPAQINDATRSTPTINDLCLRPLNVEKGNKRFPEKDGVTAPQALSWRNNLTALSQRRNLLFVAYNHEIHVWEPAGPRQLLGRKPAMIITPVMRDVDAEGFISSRYPHGINNILVDELGRDEILLLATDSGNVCGYHVESIFSHIESVRSNGDKRPILNTRIDPFFCESVGLSAWGLAVHKYARLIAVSANTGVITVFAFALADTDSTGDKESNSSDFLHDFQNYGQNWLNVDNSEKFEHLRRLIPGNQYRSRNVRISYEGHFTNIPSVGFLSSDLDSDGMWMVSTDIDNRLFVWAIWEQFTPFREFEFDSGEPFPGVLRREERGWSVVALDPRSFRTYQNYVEACGGVAPLRRGASCGILDVTNLSQNVPDNSFIYNPFSPVVEIPLEEPMLPNIFDSESCIRPDIFSSIEEQDLLMVSSISDGRDRGKKVSREESTHEDDVSEAGQDTTEIIGQDTSQQVEINFRPRNTDDQYFDNFQMLLQTVGAVPFSDSDISDSDGNLNMENEEFGEEGAEFDETGYRPVSGRNGSNWDVWPISSSNQLETIEESSGRYAFSKHVCTRFPILHFSETDIRLLESPFARYPTVIAGGPLRQQLHRVFYSLHTYDRFNMVKYLAEPGIVIAATQTGRAAVISLTQVANQNIALRIHWMLPLASQERQADRPMCGLLGLAVSPIQGFEKPADTSHVPRGVTSHEDFSFHYRTYGKDTFDTFQNWDWHSDSEAESGETDESLSSIDGNDDDDDGGSNVNENSEKRDNDSSPASTKAELTFAQSHGTIDWTQKAQERWHGLSSSRHYRVLLTYADHTVMSYEFWYEWTDIALGGHSVGKEDREDHLLL